MTKEHEMLNWSKSFMHSIHQAHFLIQKHLEQHLIESKNISFAQFLVLLPVRCRNHASQADIAEVTSLTEATVSRHVSALTAEGLLTCDEDPNNRRKHILALTAKGEKELAKAYDAIQDALAGIFDVLPSSERTIIIRSLDRISAHLLTVIK
jgi:MarR family transcriptional regulator, transcriptional regulator for hemolysin